jgi:fused signal recognition particle receptor
VRFWRRLAGEEPDQEAGQPPDQEGEDEPVSEPAEESAPTRLREDGDGDASAGTLEALADPSMATGSDPGASGVLAAVIDPSMPSPVETGEPGADAAAIALEPAEEAAELAVGLQKSRLGFVSRLRGFLAGTTATGPDWDDVEETLIAGDVGGTLAMEVVERARDRRDPGGPEAAVRAELAALLVPREPGWEPAPAEAGGPAVILVVGVNGTGKTTTIGKLAARYRAEGRRVLLAAADTFRAAAIEQLAEWARRAGAEVVAHKPGADPGAVVYDALDAAIARGADVVIADTAGRLHTKSNLMDELAKIRRIVDKRLPGARPETLFVLDATTGQNGLAQATAFHEAVGLTGIVLTKLDSTAKGGIVFAIEDTLGVPVRYVGVGERVADLLPFDPEAFVAALFA